MAGRTFVVTPQKHLDFEFDARKSARRAYNAGLRPHTTPINVELYVKYSSKKLDAWVAQGPRCRLTRCSATRA